MTPPTTLGTFPVSESRTGYIHTAEGIKHVSSTFSAKMLHPRHQLRPHLAVHRFGSHIKIGDK
jgi:hypothetical protein